jgi:hypothetical protein
MVAISSHYSVCLKVRLGQILSDTAGCTDYNKVKRLSICAQAIVFFNFHHIALSFLLIIESPYCDGEMCFLCVVDSPYKNYPSPVANSG